MNFDLTTINASAFVVVPLVIALVQGIKMTGWVQDKFAPLVSLAVGVLISFITNHDTNDFSSTILYGIVFGLMASGLYSQVKTTAHAAQGKNKGNSGNNGNQFI